MSKTTMILKASLLQQRIAEMELKGESIEAIKSERVQLKLLLETIATN